VATGCPLCGAYLLTLAGVTSGLGALPFGGLEVWLLAASLMALAFHRSLVALGRRCDPNDASGSCGAVPSTRANDVAGLLLVVVLLATVLVVLVLAHEPAMR